MFKFTNVVRVACLIIVAIFTANISAFGEDSQVLNLHRVPEKVLISFNKSYPGAKITSIEKEKIKDQVYYEFEIKMGENKRTIIYLENGDLYAIEEEISIEALPQNVIDALKKVYPEGEIDEAERIIRGSETEYEVVIEIEEGKKEKEYEIIITSKGKITSKELIQDNEEKGKIIQDEDRDDTDEEDAG
jgi:hypothetical protein